jgi:hypothetical protein
VVSFDSSSDGLVKTTRNIVLPEVHVSTVGVSSPTTPSEVARTPTGLSREMTEDEMHERMRMHGLKRLEADPRNTLQVRLGGGGGGGGGGAGGGGAGGTGGTGAGGGGLARMKGLGVSKRDALAHLVHGDSGASDGSGGKGGAGHHDRLSAVADGDESGSSSDNDDSSQGGGGMKDDSGVDDADPDASSKGSGSGPLGHGTRGTETGASGSHADDSTSEVRLVTTTASIQRRLRCAD